jgi:hypothetical protein
MPVQKRGFEPQEASGEPCSEDVDFINAIKFLQIPYANPLTDICISDY